MAQAGRPLTGVAWYPEGHRPDPPAATGSMPHPHRRRHRGPKPDRRRALELLAAAHDGATEAIVRAHGFSVRQIVDLVRAGLVTAHSQRVVGGGGGRAIEVARMRIMEAERQALAEMDALRRRSGIRSSGATHA